MKIVYYIFIFLLALIIYLNYTKIGIKLKKSLILFFIIMFPNRKIHTPKFMRPKIKLKEYKIKNKDSTILPDVYFQDGKKHPGIIVFAPLAKEGKKDMLVVNLLKGLARVGFTVMAPWWPTREMGEVNVEDSDDLKKCLLWFKKHPNVKSDSVGLVAVSYGSGPSIIASADKKILNNFNYLVIVSGYLSMFSTIKYIITSQFDYKNIHGKVESEEYAKYALFFNIKKWSDKLSDKKIFQKFANMSIAGNFNKIRFTYYFNKLSKKGKILLNWALSNAKNYQRNFDKIPNHVKKFLKSLDAEKYVSKIKKPILILHSTHDRLVPYTEAFKIYDKIKKQKNNVFILIDAFDHTMPMPATLKNLFKIYIPNFFRLTKFVYRMISLQ